jgi:hypothetical protein
MKTGAKYWKNSVRSFFCPKVLPEKSGFTFTLKFYQMCVIFRVVKKFEQLEQVFKTDVTNKMNAENERKTETRTAPREPTR